MNATTKAKGKLVVRKKAAGSTAAAKVRSIVREKPIEGPQVFASVFDALADTTEEAANLKARSTLARQIAGALKERGWTQEEAANHCRVTQPRISDLMNGRLSKFSLDALVNIASALGRVTVEFRELESA